MAVLASVEHTNSSLEPSKLSSRKVTSSKLRSPPGARNGERMEVVFRFPDDYKLNSSSVTFRLTNWFQAAHTKLTIPFNTVWLVGKTGAGKTELRHVCPFSLALFPACTVSAAYLVSSAFAILRTPAVYASLHILI